MIPLRDANPTRRPPSVTVLIVIACVVAFAWELGADGRRRPHRTRRLHRDVGVVPGDLSAAWGRGDYVSQETATLVTSQFLHGGWLHLAGNMLYLWIFGNNVEDRFGRIGFLGLLSRSAASLAGLAQVAIDPTSTIPTIGASGAIAATLGAYLVLFPRARVTSLVFLGFFYQLIHVPAIIVLGFWFVLQLIDGLTSLGVAADGRRGRVLRPHRRVRGRRRGRVAGLDRRRPWGRPAGGSDSRRAAGPTTRRGVG